jgi:DNA (cytosine-5)-methyltransferase 1
MLCITGVFVASYFVAGNIIGGQPQHGGKSLGISAVNVSRCLTTKDRHAVILEDGARYLTPLEWERLQGFPDNYTLIPYNKGWASDYARYTALGNSMAVPVMRWIGERIAQVSQDLLHCA